MGCVREEAILSTSTWSLEILCHHKDGTSSASGISILQGQWTSQEGQMRGKVSPDGFPGSQSKMQVKCRGGLVSCWQTRLWAITLRTPKDYWKTWGKLISNNRKIDDLFITRECISLYKWKYIMVRSRNMGYTYFVKFVTRCCIMKNVSSAF